MGTLQGHYRDLIQYRDIVGTLQGNYRDIVGTLQGHYRDIVRTFQGHDKGHDWDIVGTL